MGRICKLICVSDCNNNKFYDMSDNGNDTWTASWGRVGARSETQIYSNHLWDKKYKEKLKKGYKDVTELMALKKSDNSNVAESYNELSTAVAEIVRFMQDSANGSVKQNYIVEVGSVTEKQVTTAQEILDRLVIISQQNNIKHISDINSDLLELYHTIPRRMKRTQDHLLQNDNAHELKNILSNEQSILDVMRGQVQTVVPVETPSIKSTILDSFGINITVATPEQIKEIKNNTDLHTEKIGRIFHVVNNKTHKEFEFLNGGTRKLFYHGSRNENWWSIITQGLKIRPANAIHTGSMFGDGIYGADKAKKSIGYTSYSGSYWANGNSKTALLALYEFNLGKVWDILDKGKKGHESWMCGLNIKKVNEKGYDSVFASAGSRLYNNEYIVYDGVRCTIKYLIELK